MCVPRSHEVGSKQGNLGRSARIESCNTKWFGQSVEAACKHNQAMSAKGTKLGNLVGGAFIPVCLSVSHNIQITIPPCRQGTAMTRKLTEHDTPIYRKARAELLRDSPICHWCKKNPAVELDHLVEADKGGTIDDGYVASCKPCNSARGATYQNKKLAKAKHAREKAINDFL